MKCENCSADIEIDYITYEPITIIKDDQIQKVDAFYCSKCKTTNVIISYGEYFGGDPTDEDFSYSEQLNPKYPFFEKLKIPKDFSEEYNTANELKYVNARACVIYCRYILQKIMHQKYKISFDNIDKEIDKFIQNNTEMIYLEDLLKKFKKLANAAAHAKLVIKNDEILQNTEPTIIDIDESDADFAIETMKIFLNVIYQNKEYSQEDIKILSEKIQRNIFNKGKEADL